MPLINRRRTAQAIDRALFQQHSLGLGNLPLFTALPGYFGFVARSSPLVVAAGEIEAGGEQARALGVTVATG